MLPCVASGLTNADEAIKPVTVCDILADPAQFSGRNVAVIGIDQAEGGGSWLTANGCRLWIECCHATAPDLPSYELFLDHPTLIEKLKQARGSALPNARRIWEVFYGSVETRDEIEKDTGFGPSKTEPVRLIYGRAEGFYFGEDGSRIVIEKITVSSPADGPIRTVLLEPIKTTVCELAEKPEYYERYQGKVIQLGVAISRSGENALLTLSDGGCSMPARFEVVDPLPTESSNSYQSLSSYLAQNRAMEATILGRIQQILAIGGESYYRLTLRLVSDVAPK
jgi:hypothetical protein